MFSTKHSNALKHIGNKGGKEKFSPKSSHEALKTKFREPQILENDCKRVPETRNGAI